MKHLDRGVRRIKYNNDQQVFSFYFRNLPCAISFARLINRKLPVKTRSDKFPLHIQVCDNRYKFSLQIVPICCADLIFLPRNNVANIGPIVICTRVATTITLLDPLTLRQCYLDADQYWRAPFTPSFTRSQLVEYVVIDIVLEDVEENGYRVADVEVARAKDFGNNDFTVRMKTHLGHVLKSGDYVLGYDLFEGANTDVNFDGDLPAAVLIKKIDNDEDFFSDGGNCEVVVQDKWESDYQLFIDFLYYKDPHLAFNIALNRQPYEDHERSLSVRGVACWMILI
jgi:nonsense-mediated mRNA decay protein 3